MNSQVERDTEIAIDRVRQVSDTNCRIHSRALSWTNGIGIPQAVAWLPCGWGGELEQARLWGALLSIQSARRMRREMREPCSNLSLRASHHATERMAMQVALRELFVTEICPENRNHIGSSDTYLMHTALGGPKTVLRGETADLLRDLGMARSDLHVSFTHDGDAHLAIVACSPGMRGLGIDIVHVPRLLRARKDQRYLHRLAKSFMSPEEYSNFNANCDRDSLGELAVRVAAHFSLMEAGSKALGTGLRIGGGMGKRESLPKRAIEVLQIDPVVEFCLTSEAAIRCTKLRASRMAGHWSADDEYLVSVALLW